MQVRNALVERGGATPQKKRHGRWRADDARRRVAFRSLIEDTTMPAHSRHALAPLLFALLAAGCASTPTPMPAAASAAPAAAPAVAQAVVVLAPASGSLVSGRLTLTPVAGGVLLQGEVGGLAADSVHGFHIHERGDCSAADASSAGGHFNPAAAAHGRMGAGMHHAGDVDNLHADARGVARVQLRLPGLSLGDGGTDDVLGRAFVVHANADDYQSQPAGNAGARIACGVITAAASP